MCSHLLKKYIKAREGELNETRRKTQQLIHISFQKHDQILHYTRGFGIVEFELFLCFTSHDGSPAKSPVINYKRGREM